MRDAIEAAVIHLIIQGARENHWAFKNAADLNSPIVRAYVEAQRAYLTRQEVEQMMDRTPLQDAPSN